MAQWGRNDQAVTANSSTTKETSNGAPMGLYSRVLVSGQSTVSFAANSKFGNTSSGSAAGVDSNLFGNNTIGGFINNMAVGVFGVNATSMGTQGGNVVVGHVTFGGSGYGANAAVTVNMNTNGAANAHVNTSLGYVDALNVSNSGTFYPTAPLAAIAAPVAQTITANTASITGNTFIHLATANSYFQPGDGVFYGVPASNTAVPPLTGNTGYFVSFSNTTVLALSLTSGGANIATLNPPTTNPGESHTLKGNTALGHFVMNSNGSIANGVVDFHGSGYGANAAVTVNPTSGGNSATVNSTVNTSTLAGHITALTPNVQGQGYITAPNITVAAPAAINITANSVGVVSNTLLFTSANSKFIVNDRFFYGVPASNTAIPGLTGNTYYYVAFANTTGITVSATVGGANIALTPATTNPAEVHTIQGDTATGYVDVNSINPQVTHAGWVLRTEGSGGRAGRVQYETLVAMGSLGAQSAAYGTPALVSSNAAVDNLV
jgi:hypothetical protein